jgi:protein-disulfide isomerase
MTSGKKARQQRRTPPPPRVRSTGARQASPKVLLIAAIVLLLLGGAAAAAVAITRGSSSSTSRSTSTSTSTLPGSADVLALFKGIPQHGNVLGSPKAKVRMVEYIDLQCPVCRAFETEEMPTIVPRYVRTGKVQVVARPIAFIGPDSVKGRLAALAAGKQNHFFDFAQLMYANQGTENTGWLTDDVIRAAYASIPGLNVQAAESARGSSTVSEEAKTYDNQATADQVSGTPTVLVGRTGGPLTNVAPNGTPTLTGLEAALNHALRQ